MSSADGYVALSQSASRSSFSTDITEFQMSAGKVYLYQKRQTMRVRLLLNCVVTLG